MTRVVVIGRDALTYRRSSGGDDGGRGRGRRESHRGVSGRRRAAVCGVWLIRVGGAFLDCIVWVNSIVSHEYY